MLQRHKTLWASFILGVAPISEARTWTSQDGRTVEAEFIELKEKVVTVKRDVDGIELDIPLEILIVEDLVYLTEIKEEQDKVRKSSGGDAARGDGGRNSDDTADGIPSNIDEPWPDEVEINTDFAITTPAQPENSYPSPDSTPFVYHSPHYEFVCDVKLNNSLVKKFAIMFETVHASMAALPMHHRPAMAEKTGRLPIILCETEETYIKNGGPPGSAGVYLGSINTVLVPLTSLGVQKVGSGYMLDRKVDNGTLPHELAHQLTDRLYYKSGMIGWFTEGLAEYIAVSPMKNGRANFRSNLDEIEEYITEYDRKARNGRFLGDEFSVPDLEAYMLQPYSSFTGQNGNKNYALGLFFFTYFAHLDGEDRAAFREFLKAAREGKQGRELIDTLLMGRTWKELKNDIATAWRRKGIKVTFF